MPIVVGDNVTITITGEAEAVVEEVHARRTELKRARALAGRAGSGRRGSRKPGRRPQEVVVAANVDQVLSVQAAILPPPSWSLVDRVLISSSWEGVVPALCLSKWDQVGEDEELGADIDGCLEVYEALGFEVFRTSSIEGVGLEPLREWLTDKVTVLSGHSGVGKSTLLNALIPEVAVSTGHVSRLTGKGRHVTTAITLYDLPGGGILIDTPGYREYGLGDLTRADLGRHYPEMRPLAGACRFKDCLHIDEPGCAVTAALDEGLIADLRYENYLRILETLDES